MRLHEIFERYFDKTWHDDERFFNFSPQLSVLIVVDISIKFHWRYQVWEMRWRMMFPLLSNVDIFPSFCWHWPESSYQVINYQDPSRVTHIQLILFHPTFFGGLIHYFVQKLRRLANFEQANIFTCTKRTQNYLLYLCLDHDIFEFLFYF